MVSKYFKLGLKEKADKLKKAFAKKQKAEYKKNITKPKKIKIKKYQPDLNWIE